MTNENREYERYALATFPMKRKRGRPRKYPRPEETYGRHFRIPSYEQAIVVSNAAVNADPIGQTVRGFIDGSFDAGYLLTVKVANSETTLKGAVFKPGKFVPLSADNDIVPNIPMIHRSEIPFPSDFSLTPRENYPSNAEKICSSIVEHQDPSQIHTPPATNLPEPLSEDAAIRIKTEIVISEEPHQDAATQIQTEAVSSYSPVEDTAVQITPETMVSEGPKEGSSKQIHTETIPSEGPSEGPAIPIQSGNRNSTVSAIFDSLFSDHSNAEDEKIVEAENATHETEKEAEVLQDDIVETPQEGCSGDHLTG